MDELDLDLSNYNLDDLLNLFNLDYNYNANDLKKVKQYIVKLHPDKGKVKDSEIFIFFKKAFEILVELYQYSNTDKSRYNSGNYTDIDNKLFKYFKNKKFQEFNTEFNKIFENTYMKDEDETNGYDDFLKDDNNALSNDKDDVFKYKKALVYKNSDPESYVGNHSSYYDYSDKKSYSSNDIKKVYYEESVIPIDEDNIMSQTKQFRSVGEYVKYRDSNTSNPLNEDKSKQLFKNNQYLEDKKTKNMAYKLMKQQEEHKNKYDNYISKYILLKNN